MRVASSQTGIAPMLCEYMTFATAFSVSSGKHVTSRWRERFKNSPIVMESFLIHYPGSTLGIHRVWAVDLHFYHRLRFAIARCRNDSRFFVQGEAPLLDRKSEASSKSYFDSAELLTNLRVRVREN